MWVAVLRSGDRQMRLGVARPRRRAGWLCHSSHAPADWARVEVEVANTVTEGQGLRDVKTGRPGRSVTPNQVRNCQLRWRHRHSVMTHCHRNAGKIKWLKAAVYWAVASGSPPIRLQYFIVGDNNATIIPIVWSTSAKILLKYFYEFFLWKTGE